jgi:hypothetical protein
MRLIAYFIGTVRSGHLSSQVSGRIEAAEPVQWAAFGAHHPVRVGQRLAPHIGECANPFRIMISQTWRTSRGGRGWLRLDHLLLSPSLTPRLKDAGVDRSVRGMEGANV